MAKNLKQRQAEQKEETASARSAIKQILQMTDIKERHRRKMLDLMIWMITEANGIDSELKIGNKWKVKYITEKVKERRDEGDFSIKGLTHEHVYTKKNLVDGLLKSPKNAEGILTNAIGCITTEEEHKRLPHKGFDGWYRYKKAKIRVWNTRENRWKKI
jgi:hypothetical protein